MKIKIFFLVIHSTFLDSLRSRLKRTETNKNQQRPRTMDPAPNAAAKGQKSDPLVPEVDVPTGEGLDQKEEDKDKENETSTFLPMVLKSLAISVGALVAVGATVRYFNGQPVTPYQKGAIGVSSVVTGVWAYSRYSANKRDKNYQIHTDRSMILPIATAFGAPLFASWFFSK
jgi:hypothetical protein